MPAKRCPRIQTHRVRNRYLLLDEAAGPEDDPAEFVAAVLEPAPEDALAVLPEDDESEAAVLEGLLLESDLESLASALDPPLSPDAFAEAPLLAEP